MMVSSNFKPWQLSLIYNNNVMVYRLILTSACCPGARILLHCSHLKQFGCQSLPNDVFLSAEIFKKQFNNISCVITNVYVLLWESNPTSLQNVGCSTKVPVCAWNNPQRCPWDLLQLTIWPTLFWWNLAKYFYCHKTCKPFVML
jgi:hypothetical protein